VRANSPDATIGVVSPALARRYGLHADCRVDAGSGDNMYGLLGTGSFEPGAVTVTLGTSGTVAATRSEPYVDPSGEIAAYRDSTGAFLPLLCVSNMANAYNAVRSRLDLDHAQFETLLEATPPGNDGRILVPWFEGERTPDVPEAAPTYFGFDAGEAGAGPLARAVVEGVLQGLAAGYARFPVQAAEVRVTGGLSASPAWRQHLADILAVDVVPIAGEGAALGAAIHASWVWLREQGEARSLAEVGSPFVDPALGQRVRPRPEYAPVYDLQRRLYRALVARLLGEEGDDPFTLRSQLVRAAG